MTVLDYIEETNSAEVRQLLISAHQYLQEILPPFAICSIKWKIPFYKLHKNFCYLNRHKDHITIGFPNGYKLSQQPKILIGQDENLKQVRYLEIFTLEDLFSDKIQQILYEAILLDETLSKKKTKMKPIKRFAF